MKKLLIICVSFFSFLLTSIAQGYHEYSPNDREPVINEKITQEQVPEAVLKAANERFDRNNPRTWSKFPYALKEYGWVYDVGAGDLNLDRFVVTMKTNKSTDLWAVYTKGGDLVETREVSTDIAIPSAILNEYAKSKYSGWKIVGNKEIIRYYHDHNNSSVEQHFRITVEKDGVKRNLSFNWQGTNY